MLQLSVAMSKRWILGPDDWKQQMLVFHTAVDICSECDGMAALSPLGCTLRQFIVERSKACTSQVSLQNIPARIPPTM